MIEIVLGAPAPVALNFMLAAFIVGMTVVFFVGFFWVLSGKQAKDD